jgi:diadenosine tetraphosphate (Ap4A) HIT family hydrolase
MCQAVELARAGRHPRLIHEFEHSYLLVGSHQLVPGYCVLVSKEHVREPFDAPEDVQAAQFRELMTSARAIQAAFQPWKINYSCYGNQVPHVHWHLFPRSESDPMRKDPPWAQAAEFGRHATSDAQAREVAEGMRRALAR